MGKTVIVRDTGFAADGGAAWHGLATDAGAAALEDARRASRVRIEMGHFADGRGFTLARRLRQMGFTGPLRLAGHVLADQYAMARRAGFDEVEIDADLAARQPEAQWLARADWRDHDHQARLRAPVARHPAPLPSARA